VSTHGEGQGCLGMGFDGRGTGGEQHLLHTNSFAARTPKHEKSFFPVLE
jgi:hypothetical protein